MDQNNLPIKVILQKAEDIKKNSGGGEEKFFGEFTPQLQEDISEKFQSLSEFYSDVFEENAKIPAVGKMTVKKEAIAKSYKPKELCRHCRIIGTEELNQIYIKVTKKSIEETIDLINMPSSKKVCANMTAITDIQPIMLDEKITSELQEVAKENFSSVKDIIKVKVFDFDDEFDNNQIWHYVIGKLKSMGLYDESELIEHGENIKCLKLKVNSYEDILNIAAINGVKTIDFFQSYTLPRTLCSSFELGEMLDCEYTDSEINIGIIDSGISKENPYLEPFVAAREEYVPEFFRNPSHGTFIASTIQYGNQLNGIESSVCHRFRFVDIVAIPNSDEEFGPVDELSEIDFMDIVEQVMQKYAETTKIWNLSLGIEDQPCSGTMSDLGVFLDEIQDRYKVQMFVSSGNINDLMLQRRWPPQITLGEADRLISPAESVRAITVGSVALFDSEDSIVKANEPSSFSRRGPGANYIVKPDVVDYGGNITITGDIEGLGVRGLDRYGNMIENCGTSFSAPRVLQKFASIFEEMVDPDLLLAKALLIHSARMNSRDLLDETQDNIKYYGFGIPSANIQNVLHCSEDEVTLIFKQKITQGTHLEMYDFPYPNSLIKNGKYIGEIGMTLVYLPPLNIRYGKEYCRANIEASFGTYFNQAGEKKKYQGQVPLEASWDEKYEFDRVEHGFKWCPVKSYYRNIKKGIKLADGWKLRIDMISRDGEILSPQDFVLILTIKDSNKHDIYTEIANGLRENGYLTNNLQTRYQERERQ